MTRQTRLMLPKEPAQSAPWVAGRFYDTVDNNSGYGTTIFSGPGFLLLPVWIPNKVTVTSLGVEVTGAGSNNAGQTVYFALYDDDGEGMPGKLLVDGGSVAGANTNGFKSVSVSVPVTPGLYWSGLAYNGFSFDFRRIGNNEIGRMLGEYQSNPTTEGIYLGVASRVNAQAYADEVIAFGWPGTFWRVGDGDSSVALDAGLSARVMIGV